MGMTEDTRRISDELDGLIIRLRNDGLDLDLILACMLDAAADGYANMDGAELMPAVFRETAGEMEAGKYRRADGQPRRPSLRLIEGGGGSKV